VLTSELLGKKIAVHLVGSEEPEDGRGDARSGEGGRYVETVRDTRTFGDVT
jgi:translation initiation factor eIF-2B subunit epsilon